MEWVPFDGDSPQNARVVLQASRLMGGIVYDASEDRKMATRLEAVSVEALLAEIQRRFDAVEKAKGLLIGGTEFSRERQAAGRRSQGSAKRKRGGTSYYARKIGSLVQKIRHAKGRGETTPALQKQLTKLRAQHKIGEAKARN